MVIHINIPEGYFSPRGSWWWFTPTFPKDMFNKEIRDGDSHQIYPKICLTKTSTMAIHINIPSGYVQQRISRWRLTSTFPKDMFNKNVLRWRFTSTFPKDMFNKEISYGDSHQISPRICLTKTSTMAIHINIPSGYVQQRISRWRFTSTFPKDMFNKENLRWQFTSAFPKDMFGKEFLMAKSNRQK